MHIIPLLFLYAAGIILIYYILAFLFTRLCRFETTAMVFWPLGFTILAIALETMTYLWRGEIRSVSRFVTIFMVLWGLRLARYLQKRRKRAKEEDFRFERLTTDAEGNHSHLHAFFRVHMTQALLTFFMAFPIIMANASPNPVIDPINMEGAELIGIAVGGPLWVVGFVLQIVSDEELKNFKRRLENEGKVMRYELWRYSRHPNYLGELMMWIGIVVFVTLNTGDFGFLSVIALLPLFFLIFFATGIRPVEKYLENNLSDYKDYKRKTSMLLPWFPRKAK